MQRCEVYKICSGMHPVATGHTELQLRSLTAVAQMCRASASSWPTTTATRSQRLKLWAQSTSATSRTLSAAATSSPSTCATLSTTHLCIPSLCLWYLAHLTSDMKRACAVKRCLQRLAEAWTFIRAEHMHDQAIYGSAFRMDPCYCTCLGCGALMPHVQQLWHPCPEDHRSEPVSLTKSIAVTLHENSQAQLNTLLCDGARCRSPTRRGVAPAGRTMALSPDCAKMACPT